MFQEDSHAPWILSIAKDLVGRGNEVRVVAPSATSLPPQDNFDGVEVKRFRYMIKSLECVAYGANIPANVASSYRAKFSFPFFAAGFLLSAYRDLDAADIVHAQFGYSGVFSAVAGILKKKKLPLIVSFYGRDVAHASKHGWLYRYLFKRANRVLVLSKDMYEGLVTAGCPKDKYRFTISV